MTDTQKRKRARPTIYGEPMVKICLLVRKDQQAWINANGGAANVRDLIDEAMQRKEGEG